MSIQSPIPQMSLDQATIVAALINAVPTLLAGGILGYFLKYYFDKKAELASENAKIKRKAYRRYVKAYIKASSQTQGTEVPIDTIVSQFRKSTDEFYSDLVLYASPKVVKAYMYSVHNKISSSDPVHKYELLFKIGRVFKAMRKDIGLSNRSLGRNGEVLLKANITNYGIASASYQNWRKRLTQWIKAQWHNVNKANR